MRILFVGNNRTQRCGVAERFASKVRKTRSCWLWTAHKVHGYGYIWKDGKMLRAHRLAYELARGPIPAGRTIDHLCRNKACVNPTHLEVVSFRTNTLRGVGPTARNARKTHCKRGHLLSGANLKLKPGKYGTTRTCRACEKAMRHLLYLRTGR